MSDQTNVPLFEGLTVEEKKAIHQINEALDFDADPGLWGDCGEVDVPILISAVQRMDKALKLSHDQMLLLTAQYKAASLYNCACQQRLGEITTLAMSPLASFDEMMAKPKANIS